MSQEGGEEESSGAEQVNGEGMPGEMETVGSIYKGFT